MTSSERANFNLDRWDIFIAIVPLTIVSTVFKKSTFQKISYLNALGSKFDFDVK